MILLILEALNALIDFLKLIMSPINKAIRRARAILPQRVAWHPADDRYGTGIFVWTDDPSIVGRDRVFVAWPILELQIMKCLLPLIFRAPDGYRVAVRNFLNNKDHTLQILDPEGTPILYVWFGGDPDHDWTHEGFVNVGGGTKPPIVWQTYQRLSDGSYERR